jgi:CubicO group peptidase (beta-lactamase class C family)
LQIYFPDQDWKDGGSEITLGMLASHTAGTPCDSYNAELNMILSTGKSGRCDHWRRMTSSTPEDVIDAM